MPRWWLISSVSDLRGQSSQVIGPEKEGRPDLGRGVRDVARALATLARSQAWTGDLEVGADAEQILAAEALHLIGTILTALIADPLLVGQIVSVHEERHIVVDLIAS